MSCRSSENTLCQGLFVLLILVDLLFSLFGFYRPGCLILSQNLATGASFLATLANILILILELKRVYYRAILIIDVIRVIIMTLMFMADTFQFNK